MSDDNYKPYRIPTVQHGYEIPKDKQLPGTGDFTGRCWKCGSNDLWDDNLSYGCNKCGMIRIGS